MTIAIVKKPLRHEAYERISELIVSGELAPNSRLDENALSLELNISRTPLREALNRLTQEGIVVDIPYRGMFVKEFTDEQVREIYEVRKVLEATSVRWAIDRVTDADIQALEALLMQIEEEQQRNQVTAFSEIDSEFHMTIARCSGNQTLCGIIQTTINQSRLMKQIGNLNSAVATSTHNDRKRIVDAIKRRDREQAEAYIIEHLETACQGIMKQLQSFKRKKT